MPRRHHRIGKHHEAGGRWELGPSGWIARPVLLTIPTPPPTRLTAEQLDRLDRATRPLRRPRRP